MGGCRQKCVEIFFGDKFGNFDKHAMRKINEKENFFQTEWLGADWLCSFSKDLLRIFLTKAGEIEWLDAGRRASDNSGWGEMLIDWSP